MVWQEFHTNIGIGNQLFMYGAAYALAKREKQKMCLFVTMSKMPTRPFCLNQFSLDQHTISCKLMLSIIPYGRIRKILVGMVHFVFQRLPNSYFRHEKLGTARIFEPFPQGKRHYYIFGNSESYRYIDDVLYELREQYKPNFDVSDKTKNMWESIRRDKNAVALHIRRGDFVRINRSYPLSYYENSIKYHKQRNPHARFYLLSEDEEVLRHFQARDDIIHIDLSGEFCQDIVEWYCLVQCKHHILSSSTFSWWAAVLSETDESVITIPSEEVYEHFNDQTENLAVKYHDFYRPKWIPVSL